MLPYWRNPDDNLARIQAELIEYLNTDLDAADFPQHYLMEWAEDNKIDVNEDTFTYDLSLEEQVSYEKWLRDEKIGDRWVEEDPYYSAPYLTLDEAKPAPPGTWLVHFSREPFDAFRQGTRTEGMHLSVWSEKKYPVDCGDDRRVSLEDAIAGITYNLDPDTSFHEAVFGFAYKLEYLEGKPLLIDLKWGVYGEHGVLFQTDYGVEVYHPGDGENQVIFPLCGERNFIPFEFAGKGEFVTEDGTWVSSLQEIIDHHK